MLDVQNPDVLIVLNSNDYLVSNTTEVQDFGPNFGHLWSSIQIPIEYQTERVVSNVLNPMEFRCHSKFKPLREWTHLPI